MKKMFLISIAIVLSSCNLTFSNISTHGTATDVLDDEDNATPNISPTVTIPVVPGM